MDIGKPLKIVRVEPRVAPERKDTSPKEIEKKPEREPTKVQAFALK